MPDLDEDMRELDALMRRAAEGGAARAKAADFALVVRRARKRRRTLSMAGAAGLVAGVAIGFAAVAGVRGWAAPEPQPGPVAGPVPSHSTAPTMGPIMPDKKVPAIDLDAAEKDKSLRSLVTDVAVLAWKPDPGWTTTEVRESPGYFAFLSGDGIRSGQQPSLNEVGDLRSMFPRAATSDAAVFTASPLTREELDRATELLSEVPGVSEARVVKLRGMWFTATLRLESGAGQDDKQMGPVIGLPGIQGGTSQTMSGSRVGTSEYEVTVTYVGGGVNRAGLQDIRTKLAQPWGAAPGKVTISPRSIEPD